MEMLTEAWVAAASQRLTEARRLARNAADFAGKHGQWAREVGCLQTAVQFDDTEAAARLAELATFVGGPRVAVAARYSTAVRADSAGDLDQSSVDFEAMGNVLAAADAAGQAAASHRRAGRFGRAMVAASRARHLARVCGGAHSPVIAAVIAAANFSAQLTYREREIAVLVSQGLSNREIASAVSVSFLTIENHIYRASIKVGVPGRAGLEDLVRNAAD